MDRRAQEIEYEDKIGNYDSMHGTDHYIMTWDRLFTEPGDVYAHGNDEWAQWENLTYEDPGDDYPR